MEQIATVSQAAFEAAQDRWLALTTRIIVLCVILVIALVGTNAAWIIHENMYEDISISQEVEQDAGNGTNTNILYGGDYYGEAKDKDNYPQAR